MIACRQSPPLPDMIGIRGELRVDEPMARHTSWRVGGIADWYFVPSDREDLCRFLERLPGEIPVLMIGLGSNLLVRDGGLRGVVIATHRALSAIRIEPDGLLYAEAGVPGAKVARYSNRHGLVGAEFLAGIPGCMGGALAMNAGAFGGETWRVIESVDLVRRDGSSWTAPTADFAVGYRHVGLPSGQWFLAARLRLGAGDEQGSRREVARLLKHRADTQPVPSANAGSVFTNPPGDFAARLIESCGLKGLCIGDAEVSEKHANFIVNRGSASAADIEHLMGLVRDRVRAQTGVELVPEVRIVGEYRD